MTDPEKPSPTPTPKAAPPDASTVLNTLKWAFIAFIVAVFGYFGYKAVQIVTKPAEVVSDAAEGMSDAVKSGTQSMKQSTTDLLDRLSVPVKNQTKFNQISETAFEILNAIPVSEPEGLKDRMFRATALSGSEGRVCKMSLDFSNGNIPVFAAADNEVYATSKALGSNENRLIRIVIMAGENDVSLNSIWNPERAAWDLKWKATTVKKPVSDGLAESRVIEILKAVKGNCG